MDKNCFNCRYPGDETARICMECNTFDFSNWQPKNEICHHCHGKGDIKPQSAIDFEEAYHTKRKKIEDNERKREKIRCPHCKGQGKMMVTTAFTKSPGRCRLCKGTGLIYK